MKLSELRDFFDNLGNMCDGDPEVQMVYGGTPIKITNGFIEASSDVLLERGNLSEIVGWKEEITVFTEPLCGWSTYGA